MQLLNTKSKPASSSHVLFISIPQFLLLVAFALPCDLFSDHPPITVCQFLEPHHDHAKTQPLTMSPYRIAVSNSSYTPGQVLQVNITAAQPFKGFMIQARADRNLNPVGQFMGDLDYGATFIWCSGGLPKVYRYTLTH